MRNDLSLPAFLSSCLSNSWSNLLQMNLNDGLQEALVSLNKNSTQLTTIRILLLKAKMNLSDALDQVVVSFTEILCINDITKCRITN